MEGSVEHTLVSVFDELCYGPAEDGESIARKWLEKWNHCSSTFINGQRGPCFSTKNAVDVANIVKPATGEVLATLHLASEDDVTLAVRTSQEAGTSWNNLSCYARAQHMYSIARNLQKHQSLLAVVEAMTTGQPVKESRGITVPAAIRQFYHHSGWAGLRDQELNGWKPLGVTVINVPTPLPLMHIASKTAAALAMGNSVVLVPRTQACLSTLLFAEICSQAGLPPAVLNVLSGVALHSVAARREVSKVVFSGSPEEGKLLRKCLAGCGKNLTFELASGCPMIVLEDADLDSAVEGVIEAAFFNSGQTPSAGSRLLVQENIFHQMIEKLKSRISKLTVGNNMNKNNDVGPLVDVQMVNRLQELMSRLQDEGAELFTPCSVPANTQGFFSPTLITNVQMSSSSFVENVMGPIVCATAFRTVKEGITMANHSPLGMAASVWTENLSVALEVAATLAVGTVWINSHHVFDAAAGVGGCKGSGYGRSGGKEGLYEYVQPLWQFQDEIAPCNVDVSKFGAASQSDLLPSSQTASAESPSIDKTYKIFYGGGQKRPDSGASVPIFGPANDVLGHVPDSGKKDVRNAVEAAVKAFESWRKKEGHNKAQIMYYIAENLQTRSREFADLLVDMTGKDETDSLKEVHLAAERLFHWAALCDKFGGTVQETTLYGLTVRRHEPVGVIGVVCPNDFPFLGFISLVAAAVARGNAVIAVPSEQHPLAALKFHQILETSDVPGGVVNILTGDKDVLTKSLAEHHDVSALWYFGSAEGSKFVEYASAGNMKRTWVNYGQRRNFLSPDEGQGEEFLYHATMHKNIWMPMGDIFAN